MAIEQTEPAGANLSATTLENLTGWEQILINDYISIGQNNDALFANDVELQRQVTENAAAIAVNAANIATNAANIAQNASDIAQNVLDIAQNASDIAQNALNIQANTDAIAEINDGRYSPQFGTGSPEGVVTSNNNQTYFDLSVPEMWVNPTIGVNTGWVQVV